MTEQTPPKEQNDQKPDTIFLISGINAKGPYWAVVAVANDNVDAFKLEHKNRKGNLKKLTSNIIESAQEQLTIEKKAELEKKYPSLKLEDQANTRTQPKPSPANDCGPG